MPSLPTIEPITPAQDIRLISAAKSGDLQSVRALIEEGAEMNSADANGVTALIISAMAGHHSVLQCLVDAGANLNAKTNDGWDAYRAAMFYGDLKGATMPPFDKILKTLKAAGASSAK